MDSNARLTLIAAGAGVVVLAALVASPLYLPAKTVARLPPFAPTFGRHVSVADIGGAVVDLKLDETALKQDALEGVRERVIDVLNGAQIGGDAVLKGQSVYVRIAESANTGRAMKLLGGSGLGGLGEFGVQRITGNLVLVSLREAQTLGEATTTAEPVLLRRARALGSRFATVSSPSPGLIHLEAPGVFDLSSLDGLLTKGGRVTFNLVDDTASPDTQTGPPPGSMRVPSYQPGGPFLFVRRRSEVSGANFKTAFTQTDERGRPAIGFRFDAHGAEAFARVTTAHVGKRFSILVDGRSVTAPRIDTPITNGNGLITGSFTQQSAQELAQLLKTGALPATVTIIRQNVIRPPS